MPYKRKEDQAASQKRHYNKNKEYYCRKAREREVKIKKTIDEFKATLVCSGCPENHPATLDFHHPDPRIKEITISKAVTMGWSIERIMKEIGKCVVMCSNCHRKGHFYAGSPSGKARGS